MEIPPLTGGGELGTAICRYQVTGAPSPPTADRRHRCLMPRALGVVR